MTERELLIEVEDYLNRLNDLWYLRQTMDKDEYKLYMELDNIRKKLWELRSAHDIPTKAQRINNG